MRKNTQNNERSLKRCSNSLPETQAPAPVHARSYRSDEVDDGELSIYGRQSELERVAMLNFVIAVPSFVRKRRGEAFAYRGRHVAPYRSFTYSTEVVVASSTMPCDRAHNSL